MHAICEINAKQQRKKRTNRKHAQMLVSLYSASILVRLVSLLAFRQPTPTHDLSYMPGACNTHPNCASNLPSQQDLNQEKKNLNRRNKYQEASKACSQVPIRREQSWQQYQLVGCILLRFAVLPSPSICSGPITRSISGMHIWIDIDIPLASTIPPLGLTWACVGWRQDIEILVPVLIKKCPISVYIQRIEKFISLKKSPPCGRQRAWCLQLYRARKLFSSRAAIYAGIIEDGNRTDTVGSRIFIH